MGSFRTISAKALNYTPKDALGGGIPPGHHFPGVAKRDYRHAIADFNKSIEVDPKFSLAYSNRGAVYESQRKYDQAMADFGTAISLNPDLALAYYNRATIYEALGRRADAISEYRRALLKDPNDQDIKNALRKLGVDQSEDVR
jgi:tetratricopeptide (TPR) repeat protein